MYNANLSVLIKARIPGPTMSKLLGISLLEYYNLKHDITEHFDNFGNVYEYIMKVHPDNDPALLSKLKLPDNSILKFDAESVFPHLVEH
jgi:hypothetical protein